MTVGRWRSIPSGTMAEWDARLLGTAASLFQLPLWNEPLRLLHLRPRYLVWEAGGHEEAFTTILECGVPGFRAGLVARGPVALGTTAVLPPACVADLARWAHGDGLTFLRVTHENPAIRVLWAALPGATELDAFPFYREPQEALVVRLDRPDAEVLAGFQPVARRNLRHAEAAGYELVDGDDAPLLEQLWPLFSGLARRKGLRYRPRTSFGELLARAAPHGAARLFAAFRHGQPVQAILVVRDGLTAHYVIGALDPDRLDGRESPAVLLHWRAMRHFAERGARQYDLGTRSGPVHRFKLKFRPVEERLAPPLTIVLRPGRFALWQHLGLGAARSAWPRLKRMLHRP